jgi:hypothetical protein
VSSVQCDWPIPRTEASRRASSFPGDRMQAEELRSLTCRMCEHKMFCIAEPKDRTSCCVRHKEVNLFPFEPLNVHILGPGSKTALLLAAHVLTGYS